MHPDLNRRLLYYKYGRVYLDFQDGPDLYFLVTMGILQISNFAIVDTGSFCRRSYTLRIMQAGSIGERCIQRELNSVENRVVLVQELNDPILTVERGNQ